MKKWLTLFLAFVVMASAVIPCCPNDDCQDEASASTNLPFKEKGTCSPFFACGTCAGFASLTKNIQVTAPAVIIKTIHCESVVNSLPSVYTPNLFQPPRTV